MLVTLIAALSENNVIGRENGLPWHLPEDLARFKAYTEGKTMLMGRRTWESIGRALPRRTTVVLSSQQLSLPTGVLRVKSLPEALALPVEELVVAGGGILYRETLPIAGKMVLSRVHQMVQGDAFFPEVAWQQWHLADEVKHSGFTVETWMRSQQ